VCSSIYIGEKFHKAYSGIYFYSDISFFTSNFPSFKTREDYITAYKNEDGLLCFEQVLRYNFESQKKYLLLGNNDSWDLGPLSLFKESKIDIIESFNSRTDYHIIPLELVSGIKEFSYVFVTSREKELTNFKVYVDDELEEANILFGEFCYFKTKKEQFYLKILKNDIVDFEEMITEERLNKIHNYSFFDVNKRNI
jgi:hypothetical protein